MNAQDYIDTLNKYIKKYPDALPFSSIDLQTLERDCASLDLCIDFIIDLFSKIGVSENMAPTIDGILLDGCLEFLSEMRRS